MNIIKDITNVNRTIHSDRKIEFLVIHYIGAFGTAEDNCKYFKNINRKASAHYFVDEKGVWQCVEDKDAAWHCGDLGQGEYKGVCRNANSLSIEMRPDKIDKTSTEAADKDWFFDSRTVNNTIKLAKYLMEKYNIPIERVIRHYDVTSKWCPRPYMGTDVNVCYHKTGNQLWVDFKSRLIEKEGECPQDIFNEKFNNYVKILRKESPSGWCLNERKWAEENGLIQGDNEGNMNYRMFPTREEVVVLLKRFYDIFIKE